MKKALVGGTLITAKGLLENHAIVFDKTIAANVLGLANERGQLITGARSDFVVLSADF